MDPTTVQPPQSPPPSPPLNPHTPTDAVIEPSDDPSSRRNMNNFKALVFKLAGRFSPVNQSLIQRRFDDIIPQELPVPDHPPYDDMILTALWELKAEGGSSEEDISQFIVKEYHELPWAHATILNYHLRDLCKKRKITMTHDRYHLSCLSINKPEPSSSPCSTPTSTSCSSSSTNICTSPSPSSSSSSLSWGGSNRRRKRKNIKGRRGKIVQVSSSDSDWQRSRGRGGGRGRGNGKGRVRGRGTEVGQRRNFKDQFVVEVSDEEEETNQETEDQNEVTSMEVEDDSIKDGDLPDVIAKVSEEENLPCVQNNKEQSRPKNKYNVTFIGRRLRKLTKEEIDFLNGQFDDEVTELEVDVSDAEVDEHAEQPEQIEAKIDTLNLQSDHEVTVLEVDVGDAKVDEHAINPEQKEEKGAIDMEVEGERQEENQQSDIVERQTLGEEQAMDDENLSGEQGSVMIQCEAQVTVASVEKHHGDAFEEQIQPEENKEERVEKTEESDKQLDCLTKEQVEAKAQSEDLHDDDDVTEEPMYPQERCVEKAEESNKQLDHLTKEQVETKAQSADLHNDDDDVAEEPVHPQEQCVEKTVESDMQLDHLSKEQVETKAQSADLHDDDSVAEEQLDCSTKGVKAKAQSADLHDDDDDDVTEEPINLQEQRVEKAEESLRSCEENQLKDVEAESAEQKEHQTEVNQKEIMLAEVQQEPFVEITEQHNQPCIQQTETSEKDSLQEKTNPVRKEENTTSSGSTSEGSRRPLRQGLRSSSKKEDAVPKSNSKKQLELVTPVRRSLRSNTTISEPAVVTEVLDHSKEEQVTLSGRTRSSKRKTKIAEAEQVSNTRKTRRTGL
ncbi:hypothetical protein M8C21_003041 [Ambrosia artemisiifolia]|uniref:H15 domain-containing protein n=1 Tax=Ambrosia artemisiifolia TaxID=4212 RepID=A0AAD5D167_AMBAR|nr:hypothetical protein M8C21_003041 [Ambrosia artemisiifolia]